MYDGSCLFPLQQTAQEGKVIALDCPKIDGRAGLDYGYRSSLLTASCRESTPFVAKKMSSSSFGWQTSG
jgi:hypothetical protein